MELGVLRGLGSLIFDLSSVDALMVVPTYGCSFVVSMMKTMQRSKYVVLLEDFIVQYGFESRFELRSIKVVKMTHILSIHECQG